MSATFNTKKDNEPYCIPCPSPSSVIFQHAIDVWGPSRPSVWQLSTRAERRKLISTRPGVNAHHHRHQEIAGEGGVMMVGGDMLEYPRRADRWPPPAKTPPLTVLAERRCASCRPSSRAGEHRGSRDGKEQA